jgi:hypothetical protein
MFTSAPALSLLLHHHHFTHARTALHSFPSPAFSSRCLPLLVLSFDITLLPQAINHPVLPSMLQQD